MLFRSFSVLRATLASATLGNRLTGPLVYEIGTFCAESRDALGKPRVMRRSVGAYSFYIRILLGAWAGERGTACGAEGGGLQAEVESGAPVVSAA